MRVLLFILFFPIAFPLWLLWNLLALIGKILFIGDIFKKWWVCARILEDRFIGHIIFIIGIRKREIKS